MEEQFNNLNKLFEVDDIKNILDAGSGRSSLNYIVTKYPNAKIDAIVYPGDNRKILSIKENIKGNYKLIEKDICKDVINEKYDLVLAHLLLGEATKFGNTFEDLLSKLLSINSKYFIIYDYKEDPTINYEYLHKFIKENDFDYIDIKSFEKVEPQEFKDFVGKNYYACFIRRLTIVDIVFKFINGYINTKELVNKLNNLKLSFYTKEQRENIQNLIEEVANNESNINKIKDLLLSNATYLEQAGKMTEKELLLMITSYICSPKVPNIDQVIFEKMMNIAIKYDAREKLWRLAFNYENSDKNLNDIVDYFIKVKDSWYLSELVYAVGKNLDIRRLVERLLKEENISFVKDFLNSVKNSGGLSEEDIRMLEEKIK